MKYVAILTLLLFAQNTLAYDVKPIQKGDIVPYAGYLITSETEKEFRLLDQNYQFSTKLNNSYEGLIKSYESNEVILNQRINIAQEQNEKLVKTKNSDFGKIGMFLIGAGTAILIMFAHGKINRQ